METIGEFGVFFILFFAGLEFSPDKIRKVWRVAVQVVRIATNFKIHFKINIKISNEIGPNDDNRINDLRWNFVWLCRSEKCADQGMRVHLGLFVALEHAFGDEISPREKQGQRRLSRIGMRSIPYGNACDARCAIRFRIEMI